MTDKNFPNTNGAPNFGRKKQGGCKFEVFILLAHDIKMHKEHDHSELHSKKISVDSSSENRTDIDQFTNSINKMTAGY